MMQAYTYFVAKNVRILLLHAVSYDKISGTIRLSSFSFFAFQQSRKRQAFFHFEVRVCETACGCVVLARFVYSVDFTA